MDEGRPAAAVRYCERALDAATALSGDPGQRLRVRILVTLSYARAAMGNVEGAAELLDVITADHADFNALAAGARGMLLAKTGRRDEALIEFDAAAAALGRDESPEGLDDLAAVLLNRGLLHMSARRLQAARADTEAAIRAAAHSGARNQISYMAPHNLGYIRFLQGDLPGALRAMAAASDLAPPGSIGIPALDRARVLLAAGLLAEAGDFTDRAVADFARNRATADLVEALQVRAEIDLLGDRPRAALHAARRAGRIAERRGNAVEALIIDVLALRARALERQQDARAGRLGRRALRQRAGTDARRAAALVDALTGAGLPEDARAVLPLQAESLLDAGHGEAAAELMTFVDIRRGRVPLPTVLHGRLVLGRLELAAGRPVPALQHVRRGLDDLADFQARFGSQDLQAGASVHGRSLAMLGLRTAVEIGKPATILQWLERSRGSNTRLPAVRPSDDEYLATELAELRAVHLRARAAALAGSRDLVLDRQLAELRRSVRARSWTAAGAGAAQPPLTLAAVQRRLAELGTDATVVAPFIAPGRFHALVITQRHARHLLLGEDMGLTEAVNRITADLDLLADRRVPSRLRAVAERSLRHALQGLQATLVDPVLPWLGEGPVLLAAIGRPAVLPWGLLPALAGRAISVSASVTAALTADAGPAPAHALGVLAVAGPDVHRGAEEAESVAALHPAGTALTGPDATGAAVLAAIPSGGLMHVAAHGHHEPENPLFSGVLLADGLLYGYDVAPNPALPGQVVLSSCDVGRAAHRPGGEPLGLVAALLRSGVRTVVAGTSQVSDEAAADVMTTYHRCLRSGAAPAAALAAAVASVAPHPAPFTCFGAGI